MTEKHKAAISRGLKALRIRRRRSAAMIASWQRRRNHAISNAKVTIVEHKPKQVTVDHKAINDERIRNHKAIDLVLENALHKATITALVRLVDELRQPYNNSKRHDLYLMATNKLNDLEDRGLIRWD